MHIKTRTEVTGVTIELTTDEAKQLNRMLLELQTRRMKDSFILFRGSPDNDLDCRDELQAKLRELLK